MRRSLLFLILTFLWSAAAEEVSLRGMDDNDRALLRKELPSLFTPHADLATVDAAIKLLYETGKYENLVAERRNGRLQITGSPLRLIKDIRILGTSKVSQRQLLEFVDLKPGDRFDKARAVAAGEKMKVHYSEQGFFSAVVEVRFDPDEETGGVRLVYEIDEKEPCRIATVSFVTDNIDLHEKLVDRYGRLEGKILTVPRVQNLMSSLTDFLLDDRYLSAEIIGPEVTYNQPKTQANIQITIREPYRWEFYFRGMTSETESDLYRALDLKNKERKYTDPASEGADRLRNYFVGKGYANVEIKTRVHNPPKTFLRRVYYSIDEKARIRIADLVIQGRVSRPASYYRSFVLKNSSEQVENGYFVRQDLETGFKNLVTHLRNQGYLRAKMLSSRVEYNEARSEATVFLFLEEGPQTQVLSLSFEGNRFFSDFELAEVTGLRTNMPLRLTSFERSIEKLKAFYHNQGFLEMKLLNEGEDLIEYNATGTQARIVFRIYEGPRIRVHRVTVQGNTFTKTSVILKEANFQIGEILTPERIEDATDNLNKLGLFSRTDIRTLEEDSNIAERTVVISVTERDPGLFRVGGGLNNERGLTVRGFVGMSYNNLGGTGRAISGRVQLQSNVGKVNYPEHEISAGYFEPFIFNTRTRGRLTLTRSERVFEYKSEDDATYLTQSNRVELTAERDLTKRTKFIWKLWGLEFRKEWERRGRCIPEDDEVFDPNLYCPPSVIQIGTLGPILDIDYRDNVFAPTQGSFTRLITDYSGPQLASTSGIEFVRVDGSFTHYQRLGSRRWIWVNSIRGGYVANLSSLPDSGVPTSYAFLLGGVSTIRGFDSSTDQDRIPKQGDDGFNVAPGNQLLIKTDSHYYLIKTELRFPLFGEHGGALFYDGAEVRVSGFHFRRPYRDSVGFGYRYNTPVGPLAVDLAFKINPMKYEEPYRIHLSIGTF